VSRDNIANRSYVRNADGIEYTVEYTVNEPRMGHLAARAYKNKNKTAIAGPLKAKVIAVKHPAP
jgi:hypothetical protein